MAEQEQTLKSIIRKGLIQEYKELLVPEYTLGWKMERWCREHEINSMSFDNTIAAILAEVDKAGLKDSELYRIYAPDGEIEMPVKLLCDFERVAAAQLEAIKKQLRG